MEAAEKLAGGIDVVVDFVGRLTSWVTFFLALVMGANVLLRYGFSIGFIWAQELEWHLFVPICLLGMSYALLHGDHVRVDIVYAGLRPRTKLIIDIIGSLLSIAFCFVVIWLSIPYVNQSWSIGEGTANPGGIDYRYVVKAIIPIGFALLLLQSVSQAIRSTLVLRRM